MQLRVHKHACMASHMSRHTCTVRTVWCQKGDIGLSPRRSFIFSYHLSGVQIQMSLLIFDIFLYICISQSLKVCFHMFHISLPSSSGGSEASNMQTAELHDSGNSDEWAATPQQAHGNHHHWWWLVISGLYWFWSNQSPLWLVPVIKESSRRTILPVSCN